MEVLDKIFIKGREDIVVIRALDDDKEIANVSYRYSPKLNWNIPYSDILGYVDLDCEVSVKQKTHVVEQQTEKQKEILRELGLFHLIK